MKRTWIVALLFSIACGVNFKPPATNPPAPPVVTPPPIIVTPPAPVDDPTFPGQCRDIWDQELHRAIDPAGLAGCLEQFRRGDTGEQVRAVVRASDEYKQLHAPPPPTPAAPFAAESGALHVDGKVFRTAAGEVWSWRGQSSFMLLARYLRGENIVPQLDQARALGTNVLRVFGRVFGSGWPDFTDFANPETDPQYAAKLGAFFDLVGAHGLRVEFVPLTYAARTTAEARAQLQQAYDVAAGGWNVFIEGANEPPVNGIDIVTIYQGVDRRGVLSAYGLYDQDCDRVHICTLAMLDYLTVHTDRGPEWPRKVKDLLEIRDGFGDASDPVNWFAGSGRPTIGDEPIGADETEQPGRRSASSSDFAQAFGVCMSFSAGCTFHSEAGLRSNLFGPNQLAAAKAILDVWSFIPPIAQTGQYTRGGLNTLPVAWPGDTASLRTYGVIVGADAWVTNVRPASGYSLAPADGWRIVGTISNGTIAHLHRE